MKLIINRSESCSIDSHSSIKEGINIVLKNYPKTYHQQIKIGVQELIINAIEHGIIGLGSEKKYKLKRKGYLVYENYLSDQLKKQYQRNIEIQYENNSNEIKLIISDYGNGFDWKNGLLEAKTKNEGKGLFIAKSSFNKLNYNSTGNIVTAIIKKK
jgi:anti-sigma regulatory factor (Ser/Thr protein kinase)